MGRGMAIAATADCLFSLQSQRKIHNSTYYLRHYRFSRKLISNNHGSLSLQDAGLFTE